jgi:hypothetical protein
MRISHTAVTFLAGPLFAVVALFTVLVAAVEADEPVGGAEVISLEDQLKTGLKARRPEETEFIEEVVRLVDTGRLPRKLVDSTFSWALRRRQTYPFPAFERALRLQADKLGVDL